jgi:hypothetical protein
MVDTIQIDYTGQNKPFYYVRLGALLEYIQNNLMYIVQVDDNNKSPLLKFDTEIETNLMFIENLQVSVDPNICLVNRILTDLNDKKYYFTNQNGQQAEPFESPLFTQQTYRCYGQIMNIYVNMKWVLLELDRLKDASTNKVVLIDFLNSVLSSISSALGGINNLEANVDEVTNTVIIRDKNPLPNLKSVVIPALNRFYKDKGINKKLSDESVVFDLYGYSTKEYNSKNPVYNKAGHASFIKDFSFTTEITPQLSTMLTVGATANSEVVGENSTAFSRFNAGLTDRFKTKITTPKAPTTDWLSLITTLSPANPNQEVINDLNEEQTALNKQYGESYDKYIKYITGLSEWIYNSEDADTYKSSVSNFINFAQQIREIKQKKENLNQKTPPPFLPGTGFIPFNMSLTMDGLSGMKIYNKFNINTEYLPANYPDIAEFLIKNITHKIENNKWYTTLESIVTVKGEYNDKNGNILLTKGDNTNNNTNNNILQPKNPVNTNAVGAWKISNGNNSNITSAYELKPHHDTSNFEKDINNKTYGKWSLNKSGTHYVYDMVLSRRENDFLTGRPSVPSPVNGVVTRVNPDSSGNAFLSIKADDGTGTYSLLHMDNYAVSLGTKVTRGQLIARQSNVMPTTSINGGSTTVSPNVHLHIQFPTKQSVVDYINDLANNSF